MSSPFSEAVAEIVRIFEAHGATAKISSIHVNGWFGEFDKLTMTKQYARDVFGVSLDDENDAFAFCGDSPNDEPMFAFFKHSFGVANVRGFLPQMQSPPAHDHASQRRVPASPKLSTPS